MICKVRDLDIYYETYGEGKPVLLLHGYSPDHRLMTGCFEPIFQDRNEYRRIYIDLPGMGKTDSKDWIKSSDVMLDVVIDFIHSVIPDERFLLAGESYGGYLARGIIYKMAERVDGLCLLCPCIIADHNKRNTPPHRVLRKDDGLLRRLDPVDADDFASMAVVQTETTWTRYESEVLSGVRIANNEFLENFQRDGYELSFDVDSGIQYERPTLMLLGRQDASVGYKDAWNILKNFPRATFCVLDQAGHNLQIEQDGLFRSLVREWLERVGGLDDR